jgi:hypothetical protein
MRVRLCFRIQRPEKALEDLAAVAEADVVALREAALAGNEAEFRARTRGPAAEGRRAVFDRALRLMRAEAAQAFDLESETDEVRETSRSTVGPDIRGPASRAGERAAPQKDAELKGAQAELTASF